MSIRRYGVFKAKVVDFQREDDDPTPHFQLFVDAGQGRIRVPVNVRSRLSPSELVYHVAADFRHPVTDPLLALPAGYTRLPESERRGLDYLRGNLFDLESVIALPSHLPGQDNDLQDILASHAQAARSAGDEATVYVFGEPFPSTSDPGAPIQGVHDIHMNQGNTSSFQDDDGVFRDGGLIFHFPNRGRFVGLFLAFQSQALHTGDDGHAVDGARRFEHVVSGQVVVPPPPPPPSDKSVRIVGALVNPEGTENQPGSTGRPESVTLLNRSPGAVALDGWELVDRGANRLRLDGLSLDAGAAWRIALDESPVVLGNKGGTLSLFDAAGAKVDGVSWTRDQAREGWTVVF